MGQVVGRGRLGLGQRTAPCIHSTLPPALHARGSYLHQRKHGTTCAHSTALHGTDAGLTSTTASGLSLPLRASKMCMAGALRSEMASRALASPFCVHGCAVRRWGWGAQGAPWADAKQRTNSSGAATVD